MRGGPDDAQLRHVDAGADVGGGGPRHRVGGGEGRAAPLGAGRFAQGGGAERESGEEDDRAEGEGDQDFDEGECGVRSA